MDERLAGLVLVFPAGNHRLEVVTETQSRHEPHGHTLLAAAPARTLQAAAANGMTALELDGHVTDPHLHALLQKVPITATNPLLLMEHPTPHNRALPTRPTRTNRKPSRPGLG